MTVSPPGLSAFLASCVQYKIYNVQDVFGAPKATGSCPASSVSLPMTGVLSPDPVDAALTRPPETGPLFHVLLIEKS